MYICVNGINPASVSTISLSSSKLIIPAGLVGGSPWGCITGINKCFLLLCKSSIYVYVLTRIVVHESRHNA